MRLFIIALAVVAMGSSTVLNRSGGKLLDSNKWRIASESDDHVTYVRQPMSTAALAQGATQEAQEKVENVDCNKTTTQAATTVHPATARPSRRRPLNLRSGAERSRGTSSAKMEAGSKYPSQPTIDEGDQAWKVAGRSDDHITYVRKNPMTSSTSVQNQGQLGELRRIGSGRDSVLARVVVPGKDDQITEEALIEGVQPQEGGGSEGYSGYPTNEIVHPYVKKTKSNPRNLTSPGSNSKKSLNGGRRAGGRRQQLGSRTTASPLPPNSLSEESDDPPRVGEELNGWIVVSKSKNHISWERVGAARPANLKARTRNDARLKSLKSQKEKLIPNPEGKLVEGFPKIFNTTSRALFVDERDGDIEGVASIRTSLSNTTNWKIGDELAGWKVISKGRRGIVWQRLPTPAPTPAEEKSSSSSSESDEDDDDGKKGPPGVWYLANETKNSITWRRDNTPADVTFRMDDFPRVGDIQSGWKVQSKAREFISWVRVNSDGTEVDSAEE